MQFVIIFHSGPKQNMYKSPSFCPAPVKRIHQQFSTKYTFTKLGRILRTCGQVWWDDMKDCLTVLGFQDTHLASFKVKHYSKLDYSDHCLLWYTIALDRGYPWFKKAYRKLALEYHPDKHPCQATATAMMTRLNAANTFAEHFLDHDKVEHVTVPTSVLYDLFMATSSSTGFIASTVAKIQAAVQLKQEAMIQEAQAHTEAANQKKAELEAKIAQLEASTKQVDDASEKLQVEYETKLAQVMTKMTRTREKNAALYEQLQQAQSHSNHLQAEKKSLEDHLAQAQAANDQLQGNLKAVTQKASDDAKKSHAMEFKLTTKIKTLDSLLSAADAKAALKTKQLATQKKTQNTKRTKRLRQNTMSESANQHARKAAKKAQDGFDAELKMSNDDVTNLRAAIKKRLLTVTSKIK